MENQEDDPNKKLKFVGMDIYNREKCGEQIFLSQKPNLIICAGGVAGKGTCSVGAQINKSCRHSRQFYKRRKPHFA